MITAPHKAMYTALGENAGRFEIAGCYPGYGTTLGNALRRVLLSSLEGAAATSVKIRNVPHEFSTMPGVMEDMVQILLNIKQVRFRLHTDEPVKVALKAKGEGVVTARDLKTSSSVEVINVDQVIATLTDKKAELEMEIEISKGIGYVPAEQAERKEKEIGVIAVDAIYTPVRRVNYEVENMRVGKRTDYDKITLEIMTDGSVSPEEAFKKGVDILVSQFSSLTAFDTGEAETVSVAAETASVKEETPAKKKSTKKRKEETE